MYEVGQCFFQGWGVPRDKKMAVVSTSPIRNEVLYSLLSHYPGIVELLPNGCPTWRPWRTTRPCVLPSEWQRMQEGQDFCGQVVQGSGMWLVVVTAFDWAWLDHYSRIGRARRQHCWTCMDLQSQVYVMIDAHLVLPIVGSPCVCLAFHFIYATPLSLFFHL